MKFEEELFYLPRNFGVNFGTNFGENFGNFVSDSATSLGSFVQQKGGAKKVGSQTLLRTSSISEFCVFGYPPKAVPEEVT